MAQVFKGEIQVKDRRQMGHSLAFQHDVMQWQRKNLISEQQITKSSLLSAISLVFAFIELATYPYYCCLHIPMVQFKPCLISLLVFTQVTQIPPLWGLVREGQRRNLKTSTMQNKRMLWVLASLPCGNQLPLHPPTSCQNLTVEIKNSQKEKHLNSQLFWHFTSPEMSFWFWYSYYTTSVF